MKQMSLEEIQKRAGDEPSGGSGDVYLLTWRELGEDNLMIARPDGRFCVFPDINTGVIVYDSLDDALDWAGEDKGRRRQIQTVFELDGTKNPINVEKKNRKYFDEARCVAMKLNWPLGDWVPGNQYAISFLKRKPSKEARTRGQSFSYVVPKVINLTQADAEADPKDLVKK